MKRISVLVPCYNEEESLPILYDELKKIMDSQTQYDWEILFVNDGSKDRTLDILRTLSSEDERICYIDLSRNFGKEKAMLAGFDNVTGDCMVIMDADMQHPPREIVHMIAKWEQGYDDVYAMRLTRGKESWLRKRLSMAFYSLLRKTAQVEMLPNVGDFRLLDRKCIEALKQMRESERYTKGMYCWIGYKKTYIEFEQGDRVAGTSSWNYFKLFSLAVEGIVSFSTFPLRLATYSGILISFLAFIYMLYILIKTIFYGDPVQGFPTLITCILFIGGVQLLCIGIMGEYIGRIFYESKHRPVYLVREQKTKEDMR